MIVSSAIVSQIPQVDGRISVTEKHLHDDGSEQPFNYLANADWDLQAILDQRAANINLEFARRAAVALEAANFEAPITQRQFMSLIPITDRAALRSAATTNTLLNEALKYLELPGLVYKNNAQTWLNQLVAAGAMSQTLVDSIMTQWTATYG